MSAVLPSLRLLPRARLAKWDRLFVTLALAHGAALLGWPSIPLIAAGLWWNANTIAHNFIHRPFFRGRGSNGVFSCYLTLLLGFPQTLWRDRHLAHHAGTRVRLRLTGLLVIEAALVLLLWGALVLLAPDFMLKVYLPGFLIGLALCHLHGHYEHARGTLSHYGRIYNRLFFNDGYHCEHHERPGSHWSELPAVVVSDPSDSRWPPVLRWIECVNLCALERLVLGSPVLQRFVIAKHERALRRLLPLLREPQRIGIVGGGLFPRTALILARLLPDAKPVLIDLSAENLSTARAFLEGDLKVRNERFDPAAESDFDLLIIPLAFVGDREVIYKYPPARQVLVHDWIWRRRGVGVVVSWMLVKRLNLVTR
jgi:fatty acid desaturase